MAIVLVACGGSPGSGWPSASPSMNPDAKIAACQHAHGMQQAQTTTSAGSGVTLYRSCTWPPMGIGSDGFVEIREIELEGPDAGGYYVSDATRAEVLLAPCPSLRVSMITSQGNQSEDLGTFVVKGGQVIQGATGKTWSRPRSSLPFQAPADGVVLVNNSHVQPKSVTCAARKATPPQPTPRAGTLNPGDAVTALYPSQWATDRSCYPDVSGSTYSRAAGCPITARFESLLQTVHGPGGNPICRCQAVVTSTAEGRAATNKDRATVGVTENFDPPLQPQHLQFVLVRESGGWFVDDVRCSDGSGSLYESPQDPKIC